MKPKTNKLYGMMTGLVVSLLCLSASLPVHAEAPAGTPVPEGGASSSVIYLPVLIKRTSPVVSPTPTPAPNPTQPPSSMVYYISPNGNDNNSGTTEATAWGTFNHAWKYLYPGDTLVMLDGVYYQTLNPNVRNGQPGAPITIKAKNDGKATIDGEYKRVPVHLGNTWPGPIGDYFVIEGIVAKNSNGSVWSIDGGNNNILRRVSGYNANTDENEHVFSVWASNNLLEDIVAAGTGRKMVLIYGGSNNIVRRAFAKWVSYDGRNFLQCWPWGDGIEIYNSSNDIIENSIAYGRIPMYMISLLAQGQNSNNNKFLGTMAIMSGMDYNGTPMRWLAPRPQPTSYTCVSDLTQGGPRVGFNIYEASGSLQNNLWQDIFAWGNASWAINWMTDQGVYRGEGGSPNTANNRIDHATFINNGLDNMNGPWPGQFGGLNTDVIQVNLNRFSSVTNSRIDKIFVNWPNYPSGPRNLTSMTGEGARLKYRYVDSVMTGVPLWPWPMEQRVKDELGISVTDLLTQKIFGTTNLQEIYP